jgi:hypothetical protein
MRQKVEEAPDASAGMQRAAKTAQSPTSNGKQFSDAHANVTHDSFQI